MMIIDCKGLVCPEPVLKTKKALEELPNDSILEVSVDNVASKENVLRFASKQGFSADAEDLGGNVFKITIVKGYECGIVAQTPSNESKFLNKVLFIKDDKVGENELGSMLVVGFLKSILELPKLPQTIIFVNKGVLLTSADESSDVIKILKNLEEKGVEIFSCGVCLDFYKVSDKLKVGKIGNAYGTIETLFNSEGTISI
jgi:selenium metabolism protein YedF